MNSACTEAGHVLAEGQRMETLQLERPNRVTQNDCGATDQGQHANVDKPGDAVLQGVFLDSVLVFEGRSRDGDRCESDD